MVSKIGHYLQEHVGGEVITSVDVRQYFATDASIFTITPILAIYPRNENDVRKTARFTWQLAERNRIIPMTARGAGTDQSGAAIGGGIIMVFPAHMNRVIEFDPKSGEVTVEPGINYGKLQQTLLTHGRFLPPFPASLEYSTVGGAVANNACGEKTVKYGDTRNYVQSLRVVLANGEAIITERLNKRELDKKLGLITFEGEIYRSIDALLEENQETVALMDRHVSKNAAGYDLLDIKHKDGSFDLTPLIVGSQGTLGIITEITFNTETYNPETTLITACFDDIQQLQAAVLELKKSSAMPSAIEMIDDNLLTLVDQLNPSHVQGILEPPYPKILLLVEYDDGRRQQKKYAKGALKILKHYGRDVQEETEFNKQEELWKLRDASAMAMTHVVGGARALPIIDDAAVPIEKLHDYITGLYDILARNHVQPVLWGHAGDGHIHIQPHLDLAQVGDRQTIFKLMEEYYKFVIELGGTISAEHGDGRLRAPYLPAMYGTEAYQLIQKVKKVFDPYGTLNPGVKIDVNLEDNKALLRSEYSLRRHYEHLPRS